MNPGTFDVYSVKRDALLVARLKGLLEVDLALKVVQFIETMETTEETAFNRFCDLTKLGGVQLSAEEVRHIAERRRAFNPNDILVKTAFLATEPLTFGIARMYEQMLNSPRIEVRVWSDIRTAADWLGVKLDKLML